MSEIGNCLYKEDIWLTQNVFKWEHSLHLTLERNIKDFLKDSLEQKDNYAIKLIRTKLKPVSYTHLDVYKRQDVHIDWL